MTGMSWHQKSAEGLVVTVRVVPRASKDEVAGVLGDSLKVRLQAPPVDGKANEMLAKFLAKALDVPIRNVSLVSGQTGRLKRVLIRGVSEEDIRRRLGV
jgi:hypothetical protein